MLPDRVSNPGPLRLEAGLCFQGPSSIIGNVIFISVTVSAEQKPQFDVKFIPSTDNKLFSSTSVEGPSLAPATPVIVSSISVSTSAENSPKPVYSTTTGESTESTIKARRPRAG